MGGLAVWAGSEAVLPAYMIGMVLAGTVGKDHSLDSPPAHAHLRPAHALLLHPRRILCLGAGIDRRARRPADLFLAKIAHQGNFRLSRGARARYNGNSGAYYTLMMSTGLTFGTISALFGLNHQIITQTQYSYIVGTVIASAVVPTMIANSFFLPRHLLPHAATGIQSEPSAQQAVAAEKA